MSRGEYPGRKVHFDFQLEFLTGLDCLRLSRRVAMGSIEAGTGDLRDGTIRCNVRYPDKPVRAGRISRDF